MAFLVNRAMKSNNTQYSDVTGLILAGGKSRRFGSDKAHHVVDGKTMVRRVYDVLSPLVDTVAVSVGDAGDRFDIPADHVVDAFPGAGPLAGLHAGLAYCKTPWLLAIACDLPFITSHALERMLASRRSAREVVVASPPDGRRQPLCALYPQTLWALIERHLETDRLALRNLLEAAPRVREVPLPGDTLRNVNTPADLDVSGS